jgi:lysozyme
MKTSDRGIAALMMHEGIVPAPYLDSVGVWTFGVGHTAAAGAPIPHDIPRGMPADLDRALVRVMDVFRADLAKYEAAVARAFPNGIRQHEFDAAVSFHFNTGAIARATWAKHLRAGDTAAAARAIMSWLKPSKIYERREAERDLLLHGTYPTGLIPVFGVTSNGQVLWKPVRMLTAQEALAMLRPAQAIHITRDGDVRPGLAPVKREGIWPAIWAGILHLLGRK